MACRCLWDNLSLHRHPQKDHPFTLPCLSQPQHTLEMQTQGKLLLTSLDLRAEMVCFKMWLLRSVQMHIRVSLDRAIGDVGLCLLSRNTSSVFPYSVLIRALMLAHFLLDGFTEVAGRGLLAVIGCCRVGESLLSPSVNPVGTPPPHTRDFFAGWLGKEKDKARKPQVSHDYV